MTPIRIYRSLFQSTAEFAEACGVSKRTADGWLAKARPTRPKQSALLALARLAPADLDDHFFIESFGPIAILNCETVLTGKGWGIYKALDVASSEVLIQRSSAPPSAIARRLFEIFTAWPDSVEFEVMDDHGDNLADASVVFVPGCPVAVYQDSVNGYLMVPTLSTAGWKLEAKNSG